MTAGHGAAPTLTEKVLLIEETLTRRKLPHAFGGAVALAYYATPRATVDIDVNVFVPVERSAEVLEALGQLGADPPDASEAVRLERDGQCRIFWANTPIDLFFSYDAFHEACLERRTRVPFGGDDTIHVLTAEDLLVFKALFDREKDWRDIEELVFAMADELERPYARAWLERIVGEDDERFRKVEAAFARHP